MNINPKGDAVDARTEPNEACDRHAGIDHNAIREAERLVDGTDSEGGALQYIKWAGKYSGYSPLVDPNNHTRLLFKYVASPPSKERRGRAAEPRARGDLARARGEGINCTLVLAHFRDLLDGARRTGRGIVLSAENFDNPQMNISALAAALHGFETAVVVMHRPFFDRLRSVYTQHRPPMSLESFAAVNIPGAAAGSDQSSVAVYNRYSQHFRNVAMRGLTEGYITRFVCLDVQAETLCRSLQMAREKKANANKSVTYWHGKAGCMTVDQKELLWSLSAEIETQARGHMGTGEVSRLNLEELRAQFDQAPYRDC